MCVCVCAGVQLPKSLELIAAPARKPLLSASSVSLLTSSQHPPQILSISTQSPSKIPQIFDQSQPNLHPSSARARTFESSGEIWRDVTVIVCCLRCLIMSRVRISHARTSPLSPPLTMNLELCAVCSAVAPLRWASSIVQSSAPSSASCARSLPSAHPVKITSPADPRIGNAKVICVKSEI
eukprot:6096439-Pleurochrysis_carterae.AAC.1